MRAARWLGAAALAGGLLLLGAPANAQVDLPPIPIPPPPAELAPVFELVAPVASPICGDAVLLVSLGPGLVAGQLGQPLPVNVLPALGPAIVVCGSVPAPPQQLTCSADQGIRFLLDTASGQAAGTQLPIDTRIVGPLVQQVIVVEDMLPPPANTAGLGALAVGTLVCTPLNSTNPPPPEAAAPEPELPPADAEAADVTLPGVPDTTAVAPLPAETNQAAAPAASPQLGAASTAVLGGPGFAYPIVFGLPLVLLALGGYIGRALTRPVDPPKP